MPHIEDILGPGHLPRLGQGFRGRLPGGGGGGLRPLPNIPHIHPIQRPPPINFGAVAQVGRQPRPQLPNPIGQMPQGFGPLPSTAMPKLSRFERQAMNAIHQASVGNYGNPGHKVNQLVLNPTPKMVQHLNNTVHGNLLHRIAVHEAQNSEAWTQVPQSVKRAATAPLSPGTKKFIRGLPQQKPMAMGISAIPGFDNPVTRFTQRFVTGEANMAKQAVPGMIDIGKHAGLGAFNVVEGGLQGLGLTHPGGMQGGVSEIMHPHYAASQQPYFKGLAKAQLKSYTDMVTTGMIYKDPAQFFNNALVFASAGVGGAARVAEIGDTASLLKAGEITRAEALSRVGKTLMHPHPVNRAILTGKADVHFGRDSIDNLGIHKRDFQTHRPDLPGQPHFTRMPIWAHTSKPEESLIGPPGFDHADLKVDPKGRTQASAIIDPETGRVVKVNLHGKAGGLPEKRTYPGLTGDPEIDKILKKGSISPLNISQTERVLGTPALRDSAHAIISKYANEATKMVHGAGHGGHADLAEYMTNLSHELASSDFSPTEAMGHLDDLVDEAKQVDPALGAGLQGVWVDMRKGIDDLVTRKSSREAVLHDKLINLANEKLDEAKVDPYLRPPAVKGALGGRIQKHILDPMTERALKNQDFGMQPGARQLGRELPVRNQLLGALPAGKAGKLMRREVELQTQMARSVAEVQEAKRFGIKGPYDKEAPEITPQGEVPHPDTGIPMKHYKRPTPEEIEANPYLNHFSFFHHTKSGRTIFSPVGSSHDEILDAEGGHIANDPSLEEILDAARGARMPYHKMKTPYPDQTLERTGHWTAGTGIFHPDTGEPAAANFDFNHPGVPKWQKKVLEDAKKQYTEQHPTLPELTAKMSKEDQKKLIAAVQKRAYAIGPLKVHAKNWNKLWQGGMDAKDTILKDPQGYVGVKRPPESFKAWKKYAGEKNIARTWEGMVEHDPAKMMANPDAYSYYPKGFWQRLKPGKPGEGPEAGLFKTIDTVTQMVRSGRFMTPAYAAWFLQNGVLHLSQAGAFLIRNAYHLRTEFPKLTAEEKANFDGAAGSGHFGGGIARATAGSEGSRFRAFTQRAASFWHGIDDRPWRRMSFIHELNREGYHTAESWAKLMREDPAKFRMIARRGQQEAIDYSEMGPAERATFQKLFTAWGWTRGASTYTMRFPFQHPAQYGALTVGGREGQKNMEDWWLKRGGIAPQWLEGYMPLGGGAHPLMGSASILNPGETLSSLLEAIPGATTAQRSSLSEEEAPAASALESMISGRDPYGRNLVGSQRLSGPLTDLAHRFKPLGALQTLLGSHHGGGTFEQGPGAFAEQLAGVPLSRLRDPGVSAALGTKDYEQALPKPDEIQFRYNHGLQQLPLQLQLYKKKTGQDFPANSIAALKGDMAAKERLDMFQYKYAADRGVHSFRSLPAVDRVRAGIQFMVDHHYWHKAEALQYQNYMKNVSTETDMNSLASGIWSNLTIGQTVNQWNSIMKQLQPSPLQAARG